MDISEATWTSCPLKTEISQGGAITHPKTHSYHKLNNSKTVCKRINGELKLKKKPKNLNVEEVHCIQASEETH